MVENLVACREIGFNNRNQGYLTEKIASDVVKVKTALVQTMKTQW